MTDDLNYVAADWREDRLRVWLMGAGGRVLAQRVSERNEAKTFEAALIALLANDLPDGQVTPVISCGAFSASEGLQTADFSTVPCKAPGAMQADHLPTSDPRMAITVLPGVKQVGPDDLMQGDETRIAGFLSQNPKFDGVICLPGAQSRWVRVSAEEIVSFQTYMTGELASLLSEKSVLSASVLTEDFDEAAFQEALSETMSRPQSVAAKLFGLKAAHLVSGQSAGEGRARMFGYLIGLELAGARPYWLGMDIAVIAEPRLCERYKDALTALGGFAQVYSEEEMTLAGLAAVYDDLKAVS